jgi:hypothetical protein
MSATVSTRIRTLSQPTCLDDRWMPLTACFSEFGVRRPATGQKDGNIATQRNCDFSASVIHLFRLKSFSLKLFGSSRRIDAGEIAELLSSNGVGNQIPAALPVRSLAEDTRRDK